MSQHRIADVLDVALPLEPRIVDRERQAGLTAQHLLPALAELEAFFLALRAHIDQILQPAQPTKLGKPYPLGQCLEISQFAQRLLEQGGLASLPLSPAAASGYAAYGAFRQAGGALRRVWGDLRGEFFQNAFQLGTLYLDVSNDTVTITKPKVEILPFEQARLSPVADYRHFAHIAGRYWKHQVFPNHVLPELAPYFPQIHLAPDGTLAFMVNADYMMNLTQARRFAPSEAVLADAPMPAALFDHIVQALGGRHGALPSNAEAGRLAALRTCREYRRKRWHAEPQRCTAANRSAHQANLSLRQAPSFNPVPDQPMNHPEKIAINGAEYKLSDLSDEARRHFDMVRSIDGKLADLQRDVAIHQAARTVYLDALLKSLPAKPGQ